MDPDFSLFTSLRYDPQLKKVPQLALEFAGSNHTHASPLYMIHLHRDRVLRAAVHWKWQNVIDLISGDEGLIEFVRKVEDAIGPDQVAPLRVKVVIHRNGDINVEKSVVPALPLENLFPRRLPSPGETSVAGGDPSLSGRYDLLIDRDPTLKSEFTHFKTTSRAMYDNARERADIKLTDRKEVLLVNGDDGSIMEGSITTPYFWRNGRWVTPPVPKLFSRSEGSGGNDGTSRRWALERGIVVEEAVKADELVHGEECWISNGVRGFIPCTVRVNV